MHYRKILLSILFCFLCAYAHSAVFVVTSNADSGPGTLRDALTQAAANGTAVKDFINFAIPDITAAGRTITVINQLPGLSSNLLIDGTTQPGQPFGISGANIAIDAISTNYSITSCLTITKQSDIEIYGLLIEVPSAYITSTTIPLGILVTASKNLTIGAPGKGNVIKNIGGGITLRSIISITDTILSENIKISSNILGLNEDGETECVGGSCNFDSTTIKDLTIGGFTSAEGNIFCGQVVINEINSNPSSVNTGTLSVTNNFFGLNYAGTKQLVFNTTGSPLLINTTTTKQLQISNNDFAGQTDVGINVKNCFFKVTGNKFGTDVTGKIVFGLQQFAIVLGYCTGGGIIGGPNPADQNIFSGAYITKPQDGGIILNVGSPNVEVTGNSFRCNYSNLPYSVQGFVNFNYYVTLDNRTPTQLVGTATPNSRVDLYYSLTCDHCEPELMFNSVNANSNGKWSYTGSLAANNVIVSSTLNGTTSAFTRLLFSNQPTDVIITPACNNQKGSITGLTSSNAVNYTWYDSNGNVVSNVKDLLNIDSGKYHLVINDGYCSLSSDVYKVDYVSDKLNDSNKKMVLPSCGASNGSISGLISSGGKGFKWLDQTGKTRGNSVDLYNVEAGSYTLFVTTLNSACTQTYGPITLVNTTGPNIDQTSIVITSSNCGHSSGAITNIKATGTGTLSYSWKNAQQQVVATTANLLNAPTGNYTLQLTDQSSCGPVSSSTITIPELNGITMDESTVTNTPTTCANANGSLTGIKVTGATTYNWFNSSGSLVANSADLTNVLPGTYYLVASNSSCSKQSANYTIINTPANINYPSTKKLVNATCGLNNGSIQVIFTAATPKAVRWANSQGQTVGGATTLSNIDAGTYQCYVTDNNNCESTFLSYTISRTPVLQFDPLKVTMADDHCGLHTGSVTGAQPTGGLPPYSYQWLDANKKVIATTADITGLSAGTYLFVISDATTCSPVANAYTILDQTDIVVPPSVNNLQLCTPGYGLIAVNSPSVNCKYRLYSSATALLPISEKANGKFDISVKGNSTFYVSKLIGSCESVRAGLTVTVGLSGLDIANTITPNGDGINDTWKISGIESYPDASVQLYNRFGQVVFESKGYTTTFDGRMNGQYLPTGTYYYLISLNSKCNMISGSLTIVR